MPLEMLLDGSNQTKNNNSRSGHATHVTKVTMKFKVQVQQHYWYC